MKKKPTIGGRIAHRFDAIEIPGGLYAPEITRLAKCIDRALRRAFRDGIIANDCENAAGMNPPPLNADALRQYAQKLRDKYGVR